MALDSKVRDALKQYYTNDFENTLCFQDHAFLSMIEKDESFGGDSYNVPLWITSSQGRSATFARAQANQAAGRVKKFVVPTVQDFQNAYVYDEDIKASKQRGDEAFFSIIRQSMEAAQQNLMRDIAIDLYRDASGARGQVASLSGQTFKPKNLNDLVNFEVDMVLKACSSASNTGSLRVGSATITNIATDGTITYTGTITSLANNDYLFVDGDGADGGSALKLFGLQSWGPSSVTPGDSFNGVDRSVDARRLAMQYIDFTSTGMLSPQDTINQMMFKARQIGGGRPDVLFANSTFINSLINDLASKIVYVDVKSQVADVMFKGVRVVTPYGTINVVEDRDCPSTDLFLLQMNDWKLFSRGPVAGLNDIDSLEFLRSATAAAEEIRFNFYGNTVCRAPGHSCRAKIA